MELPSVSARVGSRSGTMHGFFLGCTSCPLASARMSWQRLHYLLVDPEGNLIAAAIARASRDWSRRVSKESTQRLHNAESLSSMQDFWMIIGAHFRDLRILKSVSSTQDPWVLALSGRSPMPPRHPRENCGLAF